MANSQYQLTYQVCPIILTGGIARNVAGGMIPINSLINVTGGSASTLGLPITSPRKLASGENALDDAFAAFNVLPGGTLVSQSIAKYPFANQYVAANAVIEEPLTISVIMDTPMRTPDSWTRKQAIMTALKQTLDSHNYLGGTYIVATPAFLYQNLILVSLTDNSRGNNSIPQNAWRFDFEKPLVATSELVGAQNMLLQKMTNQLPTNANQSGIQTGLTSGQSTQTAQSAILPGSGDPLAGSPTGAAGIQGLPGSPSGPAVQSAGGLISAGTPATLTSDSNWAGTDISNYPAIPSASGFPYAGVS